MSNIASSVGASQSMNCDILESISDMRISAARRGIQTPFMKWFTQHLGGRTNPEAEYMRYTNYQAPRNYEPRKAPPSKNEKLNC